MIDDLRAMAIFAEVARLGSFRRAATTLGLSPSVVSYHLTQLETRLGTALLYRSTRKLSLTHEGETLYRHARTMLAAAQEGIDCLVSSEAEPGGKLTLTLPAVLSRAPLNRRIAAFARQHPGIELDLRYTDARQDLIADGIDLAIRAGEVADSALRSRRIGQIERRLVCTPAYCADRPRPEQPEDLADWHWIRLAMLPASRVFVRPGRPARRVAFDSHIRVDQVDAMTQLCLQGLGLATPPDYLVTAALAAGELVEPLPEWQVEPIPLYALWPGKAAPGSNVRRLLDFIA